MLQYKALHNVLPSHTRASGMEQRPYNQLELSDDEWLEYCTLRRKVLANGDRLVIGFNDIRSGIERSVLSLRVLRLV